MSIVLVFGDVHSAVEIVTLRDELIRTDSRGIARGVLPGAAFKDFTLNAMQTQPIAQRGQA
jgi:hypothetical protein